MRIRSKLLIVIIAVLGLLTIVLASVTFVQSKRILRRRILADLGAVLKARKDQITNLVEQDFERTALVASRTRLRECHVGIALRDTAEKQKRQYRRKMVKILRDAAASVASIQRIDAMNKTGKIIASTSENAIGRTVDAVPSRFPKQNKYHLSELYREDDHMMYTVCTSMANPNGSDPRHVGIIATRFRVTRLLNILTDRTHLGKTGELVLARREHKGIRILSPLRHRSGAPLTEKIPLISHKCKALVQATTAGQKVELMTGPDYRGHKTLCAYSHIPIGEWGLTAKIDVKEVMAPIRKLGLQMIAIAGAVFVACSLPVLFLVKRFLRPVASLKHGTDTIAEGDLEHRVDVRTNDELGGLAQSFNHMAARLQETTASKDELASEVKHREEAQERQQEALADLRKSHKEMQEFLYAASHDLQEPLRKIQAFGDRVVTREKHTLSEQGRDHLERVKNAAARMQQLIEDLLALSRVSTRGEAFTKVDLNVTAANVVSDMEHLFQASGGNVEIGQLPVVSADAGQMRQLLHNLLANALKFRKTESPPLVRLYGRAPTDQNNAAEVKPGNGNGYEIVVEDNGIGIEPNYLDKIFGLFEKLHPRKDYEGSGIGLTLCKRIVERHKGTVRAESTTGQGARFIVWLPAQTKTGNNEKETGANENE